MLSSYHVVSGASLEFCQITTKWIFEEVFKWYKINNLRMTCENILNIKTESSRLLMALDPAYNHLFNTPRKILVNKEQENAQFSPQKCVVKLSSMSYTLVKASEKFWQIMIIIVVRQWVAQMYDCCIFFSIVANSVVTQKTWFDFQLIDLEEIHQLFLCHRFFSER